jgi:hypothetical protein
LLELKDLIFGINEKPFGLSYSDWTVKWWNWIIQIPKEINPLFDMNGKNAYLNQIDSNVFFLCQTLESSERIPVRNINISKETSVFMPIINWISILHEDGENDQELLSTARERMNVVKDLQININETTLTTDQLKEFRVQSPIADMFLPKKNIFGHSSCQTRMASDGFWIFMKPIRDSVRIKSLGACSSGITKIGVDYNINVF